MKNFKNLLIISSLCVSSLACADYGYETYGSQPGYASPSYNRPNQYPSGHYQNNGYNNGYNYNNSNDYQQPAYSSNSATKANDQSSWSNWFGSDNTPNVPDDVITSRVIQNLRSTPYFSNSAKNIQVLTKDGKVTLKGRVLNSNEKNQIEYMVKNVEGVKSVSDDLDTEK